MSKLRRSVVAILFALVAVVPVQATSATSAPPTEGAEGGPPTLVLRGRVVRPTGVLRQGWVVVRSGRIQRVATSRPAIAGARYVDTGGTIFPGLIDLHDHVQWNVLPRWDPPETSTNRSQWRSSPAYQSEVRGPFEAIRPARGCDMNAYGELRALVGGTTSILTTRAAPCIAGLVRNLDWSSGFYTPDPSTERIRSEVDVPPPTDAAGREAFVATAEDRIADPAVEGVLYHLAEGVDAAAAEEFDFFAGEGLLADKVNLIHGTALDAPDFAAMAAAGTGLVWSPRSNLELYGTTTDVASALDAGVEVALAPDWGVTGSSNLLDEIRTAAEWDDAHGDHLTARELVEMVTSTAARLVGIDDEVGSIVAGRRADLLVVDDRAGVGYAALTGAGTADVDLVVVGGQAIYGDPAMVRAARGGQVGEIRVRGVRRALVMPPTMGAYGPLRTRLQDALVAEGTSLAPLAER